MKSKQTPDMWIDHVMENLILATATQNIPKKKKEYLPSGIMVVRWIG